MKIGVFEDNLMWSPRLVKSISTLGHEAIVMEKEPADLPEMQVGIVNLGSQAFETRELVAKLKAAGIHVVGHAGHKETPLLEFGRNMGCDQVVSNSSLTFHLEKILLKVI